MRNRSAKDDRYLVDDATAMFYSMPLDYQKDWQGLRDRIEGRD